MSPTGDVREHTKTCNLCEACCGLLIETRDGSVSAIRGDPLDPLGRGHLCAKAFALREIHEDPDRLRQPVRRTASGWEPIEWDEALSFAAARVVELQERGGRDAVATFLGNPVAHNFAAAMFSPALVRAVGGRNHFTANSLDANPKFAACSMLFGNPAALPVPDIDRTHYLLVLGANPVVSNGSIMTAPDVRRRLRAIRDRGGKVVVVDPRRTETARVADEHHFLAPGDDAILLAALVRLVLHEGLGRGPAPGSVAGAGSLRVLLEPFAPERVAERIGWPAPALRRLAAELAAAPSAVCYGRLGTCLQEFGTLSSWLVDVLNIVTGNLDRPGGAMFTTPAVDLARLAARLRLGAARARWRSRVRGLPEINGELPVPCLAEEILTPGTGQIRGLIVVAGNPVLSAPNGRLLDRALASLELLVAIDIYVNETTRHAHLILPPAWSLERDGYEALLHLLAVRNTAKVSPRVLDPSPGAREDWRILGDLALALAAARRPGSPGGRLASAARRRGWLPSPNRLLDVLIRTGPHGDRFLPGSRGLSLERVARSPHGVDLGPLEPRLQRLLCTDSGTIELGHPTIAGELRALADRLASPARGREGDELLLIGRRDVRTNNSWLHNAPSMVTGKERCTLLMHPDDARRLGLSSGERVAIRSRVGEVVAPLEVTAEIMPGVVSLPHGWGHEREGVRMRVARAHPGVSANDLTDERVVERVVGQAVLNGVPVAVRAAGSPVQ